MIAGFVEVSGRYDRMNPTDGGDTPPTRKRLLSRRGLAWAVLLAMAAASSAAWYAKNGNYKAERGITAAVERGDIEETVSATGAVQPSQYVDVGTQITGQLKSLRARIGDPVKQGQLVAEIDPVLFQARVEVTRATLDNLRAQLAERTAMQRLADQQYERNRKLFEGEALSEEAFQVSVAEKERAAAQSGGVRAQIRQSDSQLNADLANLQYTKIFAPMAGTVVSISSRQGQTLVASQQAPVILRIADLNLMTVWAQVSEADVPHIREGMTVYFNTLGSRDRRWSGKVRQILPTPETVNNVVLYNVLFDVENPDLALKPQMSAQVYFQLERAENALIIPTAALEPIGGMRAVNNPKERKYTVRVLNDDKVETREVSVGVMNRLSAQVLSGLTEGETVQVGAVPTGTGKSRSTELPRLGRL